MKNFMEIIRKRRTIRQFKPRKLSRDILLNLADVGRLAPSAANLQPLEFLIVDDKEIRTEVFSCLRWAAYISPAGDPKPAHEPAAYIIILVNTDIREKGFEYDVGAAAENIILGAAGQSVGSCWLISINRERLREVLSIPDNYRIDSVIALGYPAERSVVEDFSGSVKYWKDDEGVFHVPKRKLEGVLHLNGFGRRIKK